MKIVSLLALAFSLGSASMVQAKTSDANPNEKIYSAIKRAESITCGVDSCIGEMHKLQCKWPSQLAPMVTSCTYVDGKGEERKIFNDKADKLIKALKGRDKVGEVCSAGRCRFTAWLEVNCTESKGLRDETKHECLVRHTPAAVPGSGNLLITPEEAQRADAVK